MAVESPAAPRPAAPPAPRRSALRPLALVPAARRRALAGAIARALDPGPGSDSRLAGAVRGALAMPGALLRGQLALASGDAAGLGRRATLDLAVAIELFHTASLLFDDLPAMDDARSRRGLPCAHLVWGEAAAMLGALALVHRAYGRLWRVLGEAAAGRRRSAAALVERCLGLDGILDGQARDLHFSPNGGRIAALLVAQKKTGALVRLACELPAVVAGAPRAARAHLGRLALDWGVAYQVLDDFRDLLPATGKTAGRDAALGRPNLPAAVGASAAFAELVAKLASARAEIEALESRRPGVWLPFRRLAARLDQEALAVSAGARWRSRG